MLLKNLFYDNCADNFINYSKGISAGNSAVNFRNKSMIWAILQGIHQRILLAIPELNSADNSEGNSVVHFGNKSEGNYGGNSGNNSGGNSTCNYVSNSTGNSAVNFKYKSGSFFKYTQIFLGHLES